LGGVLGIIFDWQIVSDLDGRVHGARADGLFTHWPSGLQACAAASKLVLSNFAGGYALDLNIHLTHDGFGLVGMSTCVENKHARF
jgi:hypothetical protein